jgi:Mg2+ and Co2+ transporter CorA
MNETPPFSPDDPRIFWVVVVIIAGIAAFTLAAFRARRWI